MAVEVAATAAAVVQQVVATAAEADTMAGVLMEELVEAEGALAA